MKEFFNGIKTVLSGVDGDWSAKRVIGTICILFAMFLVTITFFASGKHDVPMNVQSISLQFLVTGGGMITAGVLERFGNK